MPYWTLCMLYFGRVCVTYCNLGTTYSFAEIAMKIHWPVIFAALCLQFRGHGTVDGGLSSLHRCFGEGLCQPHGGLLKFIQVPPQISLNHTRMESIRCYSSTWDATQDQTRKRHLSYFLNKITIITNAHPRTGSEMAQKLI